MAEALSGRRTLLDRAFWRGRRVLLTGHTGFIGGWTAALLHGLGAETWGYALPAPTTPSFFQLTGLAGRLESALGDVRDERALGSFYAAARPDIVLHLAAQPLVNVGYLSPLETFDINLMGTVKLLDCVRRTGARAVVVMTTDKVYRDLRADNGEDDRLGAGDPYGGSKVCCEVAAEVYGRSFLAPAGIPLATVRAGNVLGGGDWAADRLLPDAVRAFAAGRPLALRRPDARRPWQHVLDASYGLLLVAQSAVGGPAAPTAWNIGPSGGRRATVGEVARLAAAAWGDGAGVVVDAAQTFPESEVLSLDSRRSREQLGFSEAWELPEIVGRSVAWYRGALAGEDAWALSRREIADYGACPSTAPDRAT